MLKRVATSSSGGRQWGAHQDSSSGAALCHRGGQGRERKRAQNKKGQGDRTGRLTGPPAGQGRSKGCGPHFARPCGGKERTEIPGLGPDCAGTPMRGL